MILKLYLATVIASLISFALDFLRIDEYLARQDLKVVINKDTLICIILCLIPIYNIFAGYTYYYYGVVASDEEFEEYFNK